MRVYFGGSDDEKEKLFHDLMERFTREECMPLEYRSFTSGEELLAADTAVPDVIFLDTELCDLTGIGTAKRIREDNSQVTIVFFTENPESAVEGYSVCAADYILTPIEYEHFAGRLKRIVHKYRVQRGSRTTPLKLIGGGTLLVNMTKVEYIEVIQHNLVYHAGKDSYVTRGSMQMVEEDLHESGFCRCSKSYLVNLRHVDRIYKSHVYIGDTTLSLGRSYRKEFVSRFTESIKSDTSKYISQSHR